VTDDYATTTIRIWILAGNAWLRYLSATSEAIARFQATIFNTAGDQPSGANLISAFNDRVVLDETRAFLRRIGEAGTKEARHIEHGLEEIGESLARTTASAGGPAKALNHNVRRYEVKP
jgi:hypothetical protein